MGSDGVWRRIRWGNVARLAALVALALLVVAWPRLGGRAPRLPPSAPVPVAGGSEPPAERAPTPTKRSGRAQPQAREKSRAGVEARERRARERRARALPRAGAEQRPRVRRQRPRERRASAERPARERPLARKRRARDPPAATKPPPTSSSPQPSAPSVAPPPRNRRAPAQRPPSDPAAAEFGLP